MKGLKAACNSNKLNSGNDFLVLTPNDILVFSDTY